MASKTIQQTKCATLSFTLSHTSRQSLGPIEVVLTSLQDIAQLNILATDVVIDELDSLCSMYICCL